MKKLIIYITIFSLLFTSCAPTSGVINFQKREHRITAKLKRLNLLIRKKESEISFEDKTTILGKSVFVRTDSIFWKDSTNTKFSSPIKDVQSISFFDRNSVGEGVAKGFFIGALTGLIGGYFFTNSDENPENNSFSTDSKGDAFIGMLLFAPVGAFLGVAWGSEFKDRKITYTFINGKPKAKN